MKAFSKPAGDLEMLTVIEQWGFSSSNWGFLPCNFDEHPGKHFKTPGIGKTNSLECISTRYYLLKTVSPSIFGGLTWGFDVVIFYSVKPFRIA
jgi:hypothetical protein